MLDVKKQLEDEIKKLEENYEILVNDNCSAMIKSIALKKIIALYEKVKQIAKCENILLDDILHLRKTLSHRDKDLLLKDGKKTNIWIYEVIKEICEV